MARCPTFHSAAVVVSAYDYVFDAKMSNSILQHGMRVQIRGRNEVSNVPVHEDLARLQPHDGVHWDTAIRASEVEVTRLLRTTDPLYKHGIVIREGYLQ